MEGLDGVYISCDGSVFVGLVVLKDRWSVWEREGHGCGTRYGLGKGERTKEAGATRGRKEKKRLIFEECVCWGVRDSTGSC